MLYTKMTSMSQTHTGNDESIVGNHGEYVSRMYGGKIRPLEFNNTLERERERERERELQFRRSNSNNSNIFL